MPQSKSTELCSSRSAAVIPQSKIRRRNLPFTRHFAFFSRTGGCVACQAPDAFPVVEATTGNASGASKASGCVN